ncbi:hypothetical protein DSO57_1023754 [Entomophthora muscae]|uniref:Uncharacterized protein n=1 Tax=Entomophthora muscae TaxID=34485 RepID=A0ACC2RTW8_9FUNG|nr:hypothetical protein DSO57_1023754 [Entomophthora muscae]
MNLTALLIATLVTSVEIPDCIVSAADGIVPVLIQLEAPTREINNIRRMKKSSNEKAKEMVTSLQKFSSTSQKDLVEYLDELYQQERVDDYRSYFISNTIAVDIDKEFISPVSNFNGVKEIGCNFVPASRKKRSLDDTQSSHLSFDYPEYRSDKDPDPEKHPLYYGPGIHQMKVPEIEDNIFKKAASLVIGIIDSGFDFTHQALNESYKGFNGGNFDHNYAFFDGTRTLDEITRSNDNLRHGTRIISLAVGKKPFGISPQSKWIACKALEGRTNPTENYLSCQQFLLAPTNLKGKSPNALLRPHVITNSWGCEKEENCFTTPLKYASHAHRVAGIFNVVAAGNNGQKTCGTISFPPPENKHSFVVAGLEWNSTLGVEWSSVGPSKFRKNPIDVAAAGAFVLTAFPSNLYVYFDGTSLSAPLVAGGALLVMAACPSLQRNPHDLAGILRNSATPIYSTLGCGGDTMETVPNNEFGYGLVDIKEAIKLCGDTYGFEKKKGKL